MNKDQEQGQLYFCIGLPRSGKSFWAKHYLDVTATIYNNKFLGLPPYHDRHCGTKRIVVNADDIRLCLHGDVYHHETEGLVACIADIMIKYFLMRGYDVLYDETNTSYESIKRMYRLHKNPIHVWVPTPKDTCIRRAKEHGQDYLIPVIERCSKNSRKLVNNWDSVIKEIKEELAL